MYFPRWLVCNVGVSLRIKRKNLLGSLKYDFDDILYSYKTCIDIDDFKKCLQKLGRTHMQLFLLYIMYFKFDVIHVRRLTIVYHFAHPIHIIISLIIVLVNSTLY